MLNFLIIVLCSVIGAFVGQIFEHVYIGAGIGFFLGLMLIAGGPGEVIDCAIDLFDD